MTSYVETSEVCDLDKKLTFSLLFLLLKSPRLGFSLYISAFNSPSRLRKHFKLL